MPVYNGWKHPGVKSTPERTIKMVVGPEVTGYQKCSAFFSLIPPGSSTGYHNHPSSDELMYVCGRGEAVTEEGVFPIETDSVILAPQGSMHEVRNTSDETLKLFTVFIPPQTGVNPELVSRTRAYLEGKGV